MSAGSSRSVAWTCVLLVGLGAASCQPDDLGSEPLPELDAELFRDQVYPVLLRDCAFNRVCHGDPGRIFYVLGPGRTRLDPMLAPEAPATPAELQISYDRARAMISSMDTLESSPLLVKPLSPAAGGVGHKGVDAYGNNIYAARDVPNYQTLVRWALSQAALQGANASER